jgi:hypothetical protein
MVSSVRGEKELICVQATSRSCPECACNAAELQQRSGDVLREFKDLKGAARSNTAGYYGNHNLFL